MADFTVRALRCSHTASAEEIYQKLKEVTAPLSRSWDQIEGARRVGIKVNMQMLPEGVRRFAGRRQELVDDEVVRGLVRILRERTDAELFVIDTSRPQPGQAAGADFNMRPLFDELGVGYVEANEPRLREYEVPGGGLMFDRYTLHEAFGEADAFVSLSKMKSHKFMGITLCLKNLFGLCPVPPHGRVRKYFHHVIRLSYVLPDLGKIIAPCLNVIDGLVGQSGMEWGGVGRVADTLIAGDPVTTTDACAYRLMGTDPAADWPQPPFRRERNPIAVALENGFGSADPARVDWDAGDLHAPVADFMSDEMDPPEWVATLRKTACEQGLFYRDNRELFDRYSGTYIFLREGTVAWHGTDPMASGRIMEMAGYNMNQAVWLKLVDPQEREGERFATYQEVLQGLS